MDVPCNKMKTKQKRGAVTSVPPPTQKIVARSGHSFSEEYEMADIIHMAKAVIYEIK